MLEGLATIDWSKLQQAYGEASQVPDLLRAALSSDNRVREAAISGLFCTIYHQGTVYSASPFAVPFLFEMLESDATPDKAQIASLLAMMANGQSYLAVHATLGPFTNHALHTVVADQGKNWEDEVEKEMNWADQTRQAVGEKIELLFPFYASADWDTRAEMTVAFVNYPTHAKKLIPLFRQGLAVEEKPEIRRLIKLAIKEVQRRGSKL